MIRRFIDKVSLNKISIITGTLLASSFVCYRYQVTKNDFPKRDRIFDRIFDRKKPIDEWIEKYKSEYIDCTGLNPYDVLAHLYNSSSNPIGMGLTQAEYTAMDREEAKKILDETLCLDYVKGRPIKVNFESWPYLHPCGYDSRNGNGSEKMMRKLITDLRESGKISTNIPEKKTQQEIDDTVAECQKSLQRLFSTRGLL